MENGKATPVLALLSCTLFICIELIRDNVFGVFSLFERATGLLRQFGPVVEEEKNNGAYFRFHALRQWF